MGCISAKGQRNGRSRSDTGGPQQVRRTRRGVEYSCRFRTGRTAAPGASATRCGLWRLGRKTRRSERRRRWVCLIETRWG